MAFTAYRVWVAGEVVTAAIMNEQIRANGRYLKGQDGAVTIEDDLTVDNLITAGNVDGVDISAHKAGDAKTQHTAGAGTHTHQSAGAEGGQIDHGLGLSGLLNDDHTQYALRTILTTRGDIIFRDAAVWARLAKGNLGQTLRQGANDPYWDDGPATREIFGLAFYPAGAATQTEWGIQINAGGAEGHAMILVPQDFTTITSLEVILQLHATGADMHVDITTYYGAYNGGEQFNVHSETENARDIGATVNGENLAHGISDLVDAAALAAGDILHVELLYDATAVATNLTFKGLRLRYT